MTLPTIQALNGLPDDEFVSILSTLFEPSSPLSIPLLAARPFESYDHLLQTTSAVMSSLSIKDKISVVNAHPRIGESKKKLSALSYAEQGYNKSVTEDERVNEILQQLNGDYEQIHGFKVIFFNLISSLLLL